MTVTEAIIRSTNIGMKESENTVITTLNNLFAPLTRKRVKELGIGESEELHYVARLACELESINNISAIATGELLVFGTAA